VVIPLAGTAPLFVILVAFLFPSGVQKLSWRVVLGSALIVLGVVLLTAIK
jgi:drug/metabolite transporter (DMT)-like permease